MEEGGKVKEKGRKSTGFQSFFSLDSLPDFLSKGTIIKALVATAVKGRKRDPKLLICR